jgi:hypothetical protein
MQHDNGCGGKHEASYVANAIRPAWADWPPPNRVETQRLGLCTIFSAISRATIRFDDVRFTPITDVERHIQVSIWLSVYEYTPE